MTITDQIDRNQFEHDGYFTVEDVLSNDGLADAGALFDEWLPPDAQPPRVSGEKGVQLNGRKVLMAEFCEPRLVQLGAVLLSTAQQHIMPPAVHVAIYAKG